MPLQLSAIVRRAFGRMAADLTRVLNDRFIALVAYGGSSGAAFATSISADDLDALAPLVDAWHRDGLDAPLVMTPDEFRRSLDAFPLEYQAILDHHVLIAGRDPFADVEVRREDLRRACEVHARGHLIHLRQGWLEAAGHPARLAELVARSAPPLRALLTSVARLIDGSAGTADLADFAHRTIGMDAGLVAAILALEASPDGARGVSARLPEYLAAAERLWSFVDGWR